ncbi:ferredoxin [Neglecta sp. X4]|uniref:NADH-dependent [FeFe] hydrogenase, group A6 n=1 Tax=unclassified Neglectibacter TaxID=2632164 RepID=UPI001368C331|nr:MULTISPECIES: NADH-dependent [FeFe] hydrogenase, group A6 [unclassified Neglectibacter]MCI8395318.1 2Fe-2S iron-sulfur cluster binding domain-containing protein [Acutalibacter sp.]MCI8920654.1 2Fe-2S iron-sulfur cluster binding domain-containing protein [Acutalibacter sp.]NBI16297.1 ferredoxin [Neglectibacter sp. 59]NBJ71994.1 ferredoxin [Neglectibacter sp. X4]NCE79771.1 ferredoxin [Neglectibacter sp. X58]
MDMVNIKINGVSYEVPKDSTVLEAARTAGIDIPTLCFLKDINQIGACRMCMVEVKGARSLVAACVYPVNDGMEVFTNSPKVQQSRRMTLELLLSVHERKCLTCDRSGNCELQKLCNDMGIEEEERFAGALPNNVTDVSTPYLERNNAKCVLCRRCVAACQNQHVSVIGANNRGFDTQIGCAFEAPLADVSCVACGQCIVSCPTGALREKDNTQDVIDAINDPEKIVIVQTAPAVRAALGEEFGMPIGTNVEGKMAAALRRLGFDKVFDTDFGADMTIMEEAHEFIDRVKNGGTLPMITSCSPGWVKFCEHYYPDLLDNLSSCKSPQNMTGALIKTWYAQKEGIDPSKIVSVSVMPCTAKKFEIKREDEAAAGLPDVDISLTTRELAKMIKKAQLNFNRLPDEKFDDAMGVSTGAAVIFGATGGVMEAALRTAADVLEGKSVESIDYEEVRGTEGIKEAVYKVAGMDVKVAVASGLSNANKILEKIRAGEADYHFVEIMCCPGGCVNGGGQPIVSATERSFTDVKAQRAKALYDQDKAMPLRKSHESPVVKKCYEEFLGEPGSHKAHEILHTTYVKRGY